MTEKTLELSNNLIKEIELTAKTTWVQVVLVTIKTADF